jgi:hypothetical protein
MPMRWLGAAASRLATRASARKASWWLGCRNSKRSKPDRSVAVRCSPMMRRASLAHHPICLTASSTDLTCDGDKLLTCGHGYLVALD